MYRASLTYKQIMPAPQATILPPRNAPEVNPRSEIAILLPDDMDIDVELPELPDYESPVDDLNYSETDTGYDSPCSYESEDINLLELPSYTSPPEHEDLNCSETDSRCLYESEERECHDFA